MFSFSLSDQHRTMQHDAYRSKRRSGNIRRWFAWPVPGCELWWAYLPSRKCQEVLTVPRDCYPRRAPLRRWLVQGNGAIQQRFVTVSVRRGRNRVSLPVNSSCLQQRDFHGPAETLGRSHKRISFDRPCIWGCALARMPRASLFPVSALQAKEKQK